MANKQKHKYGVTWLVSGILRTGAKGKEAVHSIVDALRLEAKCGPCGCDPCLGYWTNIDCETGEVVACYVSGTEVICGPLAEVKETLKVKQKARVK